MPTARSALALLLAALLLPAFAAAQPTPDPTPDPTEEPTEPPTPDPLPPSLLPPELQDKLEELRLLQAAADPNDVIPISETVLIPLGTVLGEPPFEMPPGLGYPPDDSPVIDPATRLIDLDIDTLLQFPDEASLQDLLTRFLPDPPDDFDQPLNYTLVIENIDTREFPWVSVEFKIVPNTVYAPPVNAALLTGSSFRVRETVLGDTVAVPDGNFASPRVETCAAEAMVMGVAVDTSCSVQGVLPAMKTQARNFVDLLLGGTLPAAEQDAISLFVFDGRGKDRAPDDGNTGLDLFASRLNPPPAFETDLDDLDMSNPCGGSPIFESMQEELERIRDYRADEDIQRVLATFADFRDTEGQGDLNRLKESADGSNIYMVGLGFGSVSINRGADEVFQIDANGNAQRGGFIQDAQDETYKALSDVYNGLKYTYCLRYRTPWGAHFNETVDLELEMETDGVLSRTDGRYPLPFVVPEDTEDVRLFMPLTERQFLTTEANPSTVVRITPTLRYPEDRDLDDDGTDDLGPDIGPERAPIGPWELRDLAAGADPVLVDHPDHGKGFWLRRAEIGDQWDEVFQVPTQFVRVDPDSDDPDAPRLLQVTRYELGLEFRNASTPPDAEGLVYKSIPVLTVQDRTPPHLFVRLSPDTGQAPSHFTVREDLFDARPYPFEDGTDLAPTDRISMVKVEPPGFGSKRALVDYTWVTGDGEETTGLLGGQRWHRDDAGALVAAFQDAADTPEEKRVFAPDLDYAAGGLRVAAGVRVAVEVYARDNYVLLERTDPTGPDRQAFTDPAPADPDGPVHARFDRNRPEIQGDDPAPPFLPRVPRADLLADPMLPGVAWWIESADDRDSYARFEHPPEFKYPKPDEEVMFQMAEDGVGTPVFPLRRLQVYAQDGQGNATLATVPVFVEATSFEARRLQSRGSRR